TLVTNAMAREVTVDKSGRATGVVYVDKTTGTDQHVRAKVVVLAASAFESARLLFNSRSARFPDGLPNSSGPVGKYITDTTGTDVGGFIPKMMDHVPHNHDGVGGMHLYMPWWLENAKLDFPRGYHIEGWGGTHAPGYGFMGGRHHHPRAGRHAHGGRSEDLGAQPLVPGARLQEPVRDRRRAVRVAGGQEPDLDDSRALAAYERAHRGPHEAGRTVNDWGSNG